MDPETAFPHGVVFLFFFPFRSSFARDLKGPRVEELESYGSLLHSRQVRCHDHLIVIFPDIDPELAADCREHPVADATSREEPAASGSGAL